MHTRRSPASIPSGVPAQTLELGLSGTRLAVSQRPSSASPGKCFARSVSVSVACDGRAKRNTPSDVGFGSSRSIKNLRRSNSTTQVNQQANLSTSQERGHDYLALFDSSSDGRQKLASLSKTSPDRTTWNILDDQPRAFPLHSGSCSTGSVAEEPAGPRRRESGLALAATFTANNRSNKGAVGNSVTTILHNNYSEKPLTPKSSNQKPSFNNILKATANDEVSQESGSLTKSQKNFSASSNSRFPVSAHRGSPGLSRRAEVTEEEAERFIEQVNQAAVTIQRWYRRHTKTQQSSQAELQHVLSCKRKEWEEPSADGRPDQPHKKDQDRKRIREEKARLARLAAIQELQQKRVQRAADVQLESLRQSSVGGRKKPPRISPTNKGPTSTSNNSPISPTDIKTKNTDSVNVLCDFTELSFRAISPAFPTHRDCQCSQEQEDDHVEQSQHQDGHKKLIRKERARLARLAAAQTNLAEELQQDADVQKTAEAERENPLPAAAVARKKPLKIILSNQSPALPSHKRPMSPIDVKTKNTDSNLRIPDFAELSFRAVSPALSNRRGSQCSQEILQRSVSVEDQRQGAPSKGTLHELLDTLKLLEEAPEMLSEPKSHRKEKYAWIDEDADSNSLTTDNLERHGQLSHHPVLPDGGALLSEAKLQSIMSFLDEMEKSEQERPRSVTSGSHREAMLSEEEMAGVEQASAAGVEQASAAGVEQASAAGVEQASAAGVEQASAAGVEQASAAGVEQASAAGVEQASATAAEVSGCMMRVKMELVEKKRTVNMLQAALAQQRELTVRHMKETERELSRGYELQKEQYEATIQRHLTFIDQLINDKKALNERCEGVLGELQQVDQKYMKKMAQMQEQHEMEIKKLKDLMSATEKIRREKWIEEKTKKIKEITVKGLEPEIQKLISKHKQELKKLRTLHEVELLQADERAAQRFIHQCEELRQQLEKEKEEQCQRERELAKQRYEKQLQEEELSLQQQRRRLYKDVSDEKDRLAQLAARQRAELEDLRRQLEVNSSLAGRALREELDKSREEQERRHQVEMKALQERLDIEKQTWEETYKKKEEAWLLSRERELKDELRRKRDKEIELAIWALEEETSKDKEEHERASESRMKRVREKYEAELRELECSERTAVEKHQELRRQQMEMEGELLRLQAALRQKEQEMADISQARDKLADERRGLAEVIRQEFADRLVTTEEENRRLKVEVSEVRARLRLEVERLSREKEEELAEVHQRVKSAILKKEEIVSTLQKQYQAAVKRADHLEALWEQQKKQLLEK